MTIGIKIQRQMKAEFGVPTVDEIRDMVRGSENAQNRALVAIYHGQTAQEKMSATTVEDNGIGFSGVDAEILTSFAEQFLRRQFLSPKQRAILAKKMPKYAGQLWQIAVAKRKGEAPAVTAKPRLSAEEIAEREAADKECERLNARIATLCEMRRSAQPDGAYALMLDKEIDALSERVGLIQEAAYC